MIKILSEYIIIRAELKNIKLNLVEDESTTNVERAVANLSKVLIEDYSKQMIKNNISNEVSDICKGIGKP
jgi:hypothetical protein